MIAMVRSRLASLVDHKDNALRHAESEAVMCIIHILYHN